MVTQILDGLISQAVETSAQKSADWNQLISSAKNPCNFTTNEFTDGTLSSEQEDFDTLSVQKGVCLVPYAFKYDLFNESDTAPSSENEETIKRKSESSDEMMGKGKRKRFQNVRMLPIDNVVKSPSRNTNK